VTPTILSRFFKIFSSRVVSLLALLLATPVIVRVLGPSGYGDYAFLLSALGVMMLLVDVGIFDGIRKFMTEADRPERWKSQVFAFYLRFAAALIATLVIGIVLAVRFGLIARYFQSTYEQYFLVLAALVVARQFAAVTRSALMGMDLEKISESLQIANKLIFVGLGLGLLIQGYGIIGLLAGRIAGHLLMVAVGGVALARELDMSVLFERLPESFPRRELIGFNVGSFVLFGLYVSILHLDVLLIQWFQGSAQTGVYRAALTLAEFLWFVPRILQMTLLHSTSKLWSESDHERITDIASKTTRYTLLFTLLLVIGLAALARPFVTTYYGPEFEGAVEPLLILLPGALGFAVARPLFAIGQGNGDLRPLNYATGGAALVNLVGNLLLIPQFGIRGAAVATTTSYLSMLVFHFWSARSIGFDPASDLRLGRIALTGVVSAIPIFLLAKVITMDYLALAVVPPVGFVVYAGISLLSGVVDRDEVPNFSAYL